MLYIHAGTGKTGTTYLQSYLAANADRLGIRYPITGRQLNGGQKLWDAHHALALDYRGANSKAEWDLLIHAIKSHGDNDDSKWLVSTENLTYASNAFLEWLSTRLDSAGINYTFSLFVRDAPSYAESTFLAKVGVGRVPLYIDICDFLNRHIQGLLVDQLIAKFLAASGDKLILLDYNQSRLRGTLLEDFLHALGVVHPAPRWGAATGHVPIINESLCLNIANCLTYLTAAILDGLSSDVNPKTMLHCYLSSLEKDVVESASFVRESKRIRSLIKEAYRHARKARLADYLLEAHATSLAHEFNSAWRDSRISLKPSQAVLMDITRSERLPQLKISQEKTQLYLEKMRTKYVA
jgi:hypothetical protein